MLWDCAESKRRFQTSGQNPKKSGSSIVMEKQMIGEAEDVPGDIRSLKKVGEENFRTQ